MEEFHPALIDMFCHVLPPKYKEALFEILPQGNFFRDNISNMPQFWDMEQRLKLMDIEGYAQVLSLMSPPIETIADPKKAVELAKLANDGMAELVGKYPSKFVAAIATLPMNNIEATLREADRCINDLGFKGILLYTPSDNKPLDSPEFIPLYEKMANYNLPIWIHPQRDESYPYYEGESYVKFRENVSFGWPFETTLGMNRLVYSGVLARYPDLKFIVHHGGAMVPFFASRIPATQDRPGGQSVYGTLSKPPIEYFKMFYADIASIRTTAAFNLVYQFFGIDHIVYGTDFPFGNINTSISVIEQSGIDRTEQAKIFESNCKMLLRLP